MYAGQIVLDLALQELGDQRRGVGVVIEQLNGDFLNAELFLGDLPILLRLHLIGLQIERRGLTEVLAVRAGGQPVRDREVGGRGAVLQDFKADHVLVIAQCDGHAQVFVLKAAGILLALRIEVGGEIPQIALFDAGEAVHGLVLHDLVAGEADIIQRAVFIGKHRLLRILDDLEIDFVQIDLVRVIVAGVFLELIGVAAHVPGRHVEGAAAEQLVGAQRILAAELRGKGLVDRTEAGEGHQVQEIGNRMIQLDLQGLAVHSADAEFLDGQLAADDGRCVLHGRHFHHEAVFGGSHGIDQTAPCENKVVRRDGYAVHPVGVLTNVKHILGRFLVRLIGCAQCIDRRAVRSGDEERLDDRGDNFQAVGLRGDRGIHVEQLSHTADIQHLVVAVLCGIGRRGVGGGRRSRNRFLRGRSTAARQHQQSQQKRQDLLPGFHGVLSFFHGSVKAEP